MTAAFSWIAALFTLLLRFLVGDYAWTEGQKDNSFREELSFLKLELDELRTELQQTENSDADELIEELTARVRKTSASKIADETKSIIRESEFRYDFNSRFAKSLMRIEKEVSSLTRRGAVNLLLGISMAFLGIWMLGYYGLGSAAEASNLSELALKFLPRLSVVLIIEVFSYFFLRLYKNTLDEIKYFQNEATNLELKFAALEFAIHTNDKQLYNDIIAAFIKTERNPLIGQGMTTRELESQKLTDERFTLSPEYLIQVLKATRGEG